MPSASAAILRACRGDSTPLAFAIPQGGGSGIRGAGSGEPAHLTGIEREGSSKMAEREIGGDG